MSKYRHVSSLKTTLAECAITVSACSLRCEDPCVSSACCTVGRGHSLFKIALQTQLLVSSQKIDYSCSMNVDRHRQQMIASQLFFYFSSVFQTRERKNTEYHVSCFLQHTVLCSLSVFTLPTSCFAGKKRKKKRKIGKETCYQQGGRHRSYPYKCALFKTDVYHTDRCEHICDLPLRPSDAGEKL